MEQLEHAPISNAYALAQLDRVHAHLSDHDVLCDSVHISTLYKTLVPTMRRFCDSAPALGYVAKLRGLQPVSDDVFKQLEDAATERRQKRRRGGS